MHLHLQMIFFLDSETFISLFAFKGAVFKACIHLQKEGGWMEKHKALCIWNHTIMSLGNLENYEA